MSAFNDWGDPDPDHQPRSLLEDIEIIEPADVECQYCGAMAMERCNPDCLGQVE